MNVEDQGLGDLGKDRADLFAIVEAEHLRVAPCFMTGKGCVYTEAIDAEISKRRDRKHHAAFMIMPFRPNLNIFHNLTLRRFLGSNYSSLSSSSHDSGADSATTECNAASLNIVRADQVSQTGYVICNKICKKIQDSDFVIADVSLRNANVFYELGLAYGLRHKIVLIHHQHSTFGQEMATALGAKAYKYVDLKLIKSSEFLMSTYLWQQSSTSTVPHDSPNILVLDLYPNDPCESPHDDIALSFTTHVEAAIGVAVVDIHSQLVQEHHAVTSIYGRQISNLATATSILAAERRSFADTKLAINRSFCTVIRTGTEQCDPMAYFWLGYCHAVGKNVIPVTVVDHINDPVEDLAFDIRALWHMRFARSSPSLFMAGLQEALRQMIEDDFSEWSRKAFWNEITGKRGEVSIFTGALHNESLGREMTGDWDLRAVSELTSYLAGHQYRPKIESPVYAPRFPADQLDRKQEYITGLKALLTDKNCVLVASPDVNPLTEIALGALYGVPEEHWFDSAYDLRSTPHTVRAVKKKPLKDTPTTGSLGAVGRTFYKEELTSEPEHWRGFETTIVQITPERFFMSSDGQSDFRTYAHLVVAPNPFRSRQHDDKKFLIILNGVGGPATFALTHVLTGRVNWAAYPPDFNCPSRSEEDLRTINTELARLDARGGGLQYIFEVEIGSAVADTVPQVLYDGRRVKGWQPLECMPQFRALGARTKPGSSVDRGEALSAGAGAAPGQGGSKKERI